MRVGTTTEYKQGNVTFIIAPHQTVVATPLQRFYLYPIQSYWNRRLAMIRILISAGEITTLDDLSYWCKERDKRTGEALETVIEWRASSLPLETLVYSGKQI